MRWFPIVFLVAATVASARDVVIPPLIDPPVLTEQLVFVPAINRAQTREVARVRFEPMADGDGVVQTLAEPLSLPAEMHTPLAASMRIELEGATASRARFTNVSPGTVFWLAGSEDEEFIRYAPDAADSWGPTTHGSTMFIATQGSFGSAAITALASVRSVRSDSNACMEDVACPAASDAFARVMDASRAIAYVRFVRNGQSYVCTGALVSDAAGSRTPYLLTARHCIDTPEAAASVEIIWDLRSSACGSNRMAKYSRTLGAELLVASKQTDVALLKLKSVPAGRVFLGIDTRPLEPGTIVHRISHASGLSQTFASSVIDGNGRTCSSAPRPSFVYSKPTLGGITTGSSGAPMLVNGLYVAGQLLGLCGTNLSNPCATMNDAVDGAIRESWPLLARHLDPSSVKPRRRAVR